MDLTGMNRPSVAGYLLITSKPFQTGIKIAMKSSLFEIEHGTYPFSVLVAIGSTDKEIEAFLEKQFDYELDDNERERIKMEGVGRTVMLDTGATILRVRLLKDKNEVMGNLVHEIFHAVEFLFGKIGLPHDPNISSEAYAYQIAFLTKGILKKMV
jgi:hypothetical protein